MKGWPFTQAAIYNLELNNKHTTSLIIEGRSAPSSSQARGISPEMALLLVLDNILAEPISPSTLLHALGLRKALARL